MRRDASIDPFGIISPGKKNYFIKPRNKNRSFEFENFSASKNDSIAGNTLNLFLDATKINIFLVLILCGILLLAGRTAFLQLYQGEHYRALAEGNRIRLRDTKATRGIIYDRNMVQLVENSPGFSLAAIPVDLPKDPEVRKSLIVDIQNITNKPAEETETLLFPEKPLYSYQPITVVDDLTPDQAVLARILSSKYNGLTLRIDSTRHYLLSSTTQSFSHILGYQGKIEDGKLQEYLKDGYLYDDKIGKSGLEFTYEKELKGVNGIEQVEVEATGKAKEILASQKPISGNNLLLSIDSRLQKVAETSLKKALGSTGKKKGSVIAIDPNNGEILALVSWPAFNNNDFVRGLSQDKFQELINDPNLPLFNRSISGEYPPGSTFKIVVASAALEEKIVTENTGFMSTGGIYFNKTWFFPDWKAGGHGWTNVTKALAESVNTFFYIVGGGYQDFVGLGPERIEAYGEKFGLGKKTGIDLPNEATGFLPTPKWKEETKNEQWYIGDTYHFAIGQGDVLVTPLQVALWTSAIANDGKIFKPHIVKSILDSQNELISETKPEIISQDFLSQKNINIIKKGLRETVLTGSGRSLGSLPIAVAAKTGTAQWSTKKLPQAWVTAYAPFENPEIVVTVLVEEGGEGSSVATPVAREILGWWANKDNPQSTSTPKVEN